MKISLALACASIIIGFTSSGCYYDVDEELNPKDTTSVCDTTALNFEKISAVFAQGTCLDCHTGATASGGLDLSTYAGTSLYLASSSATFVYRIKDAGPDEIMPPSGTKLNDCNVSKIKAWINAGFPQ